MFKFNFISLVDERHNTEDIGGYEALKLYCYHETVYGPNKSIIESDGVEVDPEEIAAH